MEWVYTYSGAQSQTIVRCRYWKQDLYDLEHNLHAKLPILLKMLSALFVKLHSATMLITTEFSKIENMRCAVCVNHKITWLYSPGIVNQADDTQTYIHIRIRIRIHVGATR